MGPSLATDRISLGFWLTISFAVNYRGAFRSIVAIAIDLLTIIFSDSQRCLCRDGVYNPDNIRDRTCAVLHLRWAGHWICDLSRIIANWCSYCSINPLHPPNCICLQSNLSCLYKLNCNLFNHHERPPAIRHFFLLIVTAGDCAMTWAFHVIQKICRIKI